MEMSIGFQAMPLWKPPWQGPVRSALDQTRRAMFALSSRFIGEARQ